MRPTIASTTGTAPSTGNPIGAQEDRKDPRRLDDSRTVRGQALRYKRNAGRDDREALSLEVAAREYIWLYDNRNGVTCGEIAAREKVAVDRVRFGVKRAKALEGRLSKQDLIDDLKAARLDDLGFRLTPLFPIGAFTPQSACPHRDPMKRGSGLCCMVCHASGMDDHPGLRRDPAADPSPEPEDAEGSVDPASWPGPSPSTETRKQRRRRQFVEAIAAQAAL